MSVDFVLGIPTESLAVRAVVASTVAVIGARLLLRAGLRLPRVRVLAALVPALALAAVVAVGIGSARLPALMMPTDAGGLPIRVGGEYLNVAPLAIPVLIGLWATVAGVRIGLRVRRHLRTRREAAAAFGARSSADPRVRRLLRDVAGSLGVPAPPVALTQGCAGGATVVGIRNPVVLADEDLLARLDDDELEGVLAHELAHVRRRDNLVSLLLGLVRDLTFFVPGGRWALRRLHAERELAADQTAVTATDRPGALASGLLKVLDGGVEEPACAALMPSGTLVGRVRQLVDDRPSVGRTRSAMEILLVVGVAAVAVAGALQLPAVVRDGGVREGLILLWHSEAEAEAAAGPAQASGSPARVFDVYHDSRLEIGREAPPAGLPVEDEPGEMHPRELQACAAGVRCPDRGPPGLGLRPREPVRVEADHLIAQWDATPVVTNDEGLSLYLLSSVAR